MKMLWTKYKETVDEIKLLTDEHFRDKEVLLEAVWDMEKEMEFYKSVVNMAFQHEETDWIWAKSKYDPD